MVPLFGTIHNKCAQNKQVTEQQSSDDHLVSKWVFNKSKMFCNMFELKLNIERMDNILLSPSYSTVIFLGDAEQKKILAWKTTNKY